MRPGLLLLILFFHLVCHLGRAQESTLPCPSPTTNFLYQVEVEPSAHYLWTDAQRTVSLLGSHAPAILSAYQNAIGSWQTAMSNASYASEENDLEKLWKEIISHFTRGSLDKLKEMNILVRQARIIDDYSYRLFELARKNNLAKIKDKKSFPLTLREYFLLAKALRNKSRVCPQFLSEEELQALPITKEFLYPLKTPWKRIRGQYARERLLTQFSYFEIGLISEAIMRTMNFMAARKASVEFEFRDEESKTRIERIDLSAADQYRLSLQLFLRNFEILQVERFSGRDLAYQDFLAASLATGVIQNSDLNSVKKFEDYWNPQVGDLERVFNIVGKVVGFFPYGYWFTAGKAGLEALNEKRNPKARHRQRLF